MPTPPDFLPPGATCCPEGVHFKVWAPNARQAWVTGAFHDGEPAQQMLDSQAGGWWQGFVPGIGPGTRYKFRLDTGEGCVDRIDPCARAVTNSVGDGVVVDHTAFDWQGDAFDCPPHHRLAIYEMHIGSFNPSTAERPGGFHEAIERLPHLRRLGINAVQVMPVAEFAGDRSWGYNPAHLFAVESAYGGPDAFRTFVREAHRLGLAVILDVVYNHFGPSDLDLWRFDGWHEGEGGGIYFYNDHRAETPWGATRPDYGRAEVRGFIRDNAMMWMDEYHVDGLRMDMTLYMRSIGGGEGDDLPDGWSLMQWLTSEIRARHPRAITISEDLRDLPAVTAPAEAGGAGFHAQWDARFVHPVRAAVIDADDARRSMDAVAGAVAHRYGDDAFSRVIYSESHDEVANGKSRIPHEIAGDDVGHWAAQKRSALAAALVCTAPGIPMLFQGQEFLQGGWFRDDVPLDWDQSTTFRGMVRLYRDLLALRLDRDGCSAGLSGHGVQVFHVNDAMNMLAFHRWDQGGPGDSVVVVVNLSADSRGDYRIGLPASGRWRVRFNSDASAYGDAGHDEGSAEVTADGDGQDGLPSSGVLGLAPYAVLVLSQDRGC